MLRKYHTALSLFAMIFLFIVACSGVVLSVIPSLHKASLVSIPNGTQNVATLAQSVTARYGQVSRMERNQYGDMVVYYQKQGVNAAYIIHPHTGERLATYHPSAFVVWVKDLHRAFLLGNTGRMLAGMMAVIMTLIVVSGTFLLVRRMGRWQALLTPIKGTGSTRIHAELARFALLGLLLSSLTGVYMSAVRFGVFSNESYIEAPFPETVSGGQPMPVNRLPVLMATDVNALKELIFPEPDDLQDVYSFTTRNGVGFIDQSTGHWLQFVSLSDKGHIQQWITDLHTGEGFWWLGLILGAMVLTVPVLSFTGAQTWWRRRKARPVWDNNIIGNDVISAPEVLVLVGSEGNTTWRFAQELTSQLQQAGLKVQCTEMNQLTTHYPSVRQLFVLTSTYGDGQAPASASQFLAKLAHFTPDHMTFCVLGFGDRQFARFCQYAVDVDKALHQTGLLRFHNVSFIHRSSSLEWQQWGRSIRHETGIPLSLNAISAPDNTLALTLFEREDFGQDPATATSIMRFQLSPEQTMPAFDAGDLLSVIAPHSTGPRLYSLASSNIDGVVEICVRRHAQGVCSTYLHRLALGDQVQASIRFNVSFRPHYTGKPIILIGAGTGIGPLMGFIRNNRQSCPLYLYWGARTKAFDFLYETELNTCLNDKRLTQLHTVFSQDSAHDGCKRYVQDALLNDAVALLDRLENQAHILVCGGKDMATGVALAINEILKPTSVDVDTLKAQGRYLEDVY